MKLSIIFAALLFGACSQTTEPISVRTAAVSLPEHTEWKALSSNTSNQFRNAIAITMERLTIATMTSNCNKTTTMAQEGFVTEQAGWNGHFPGYVIIGRLYDVENAQYLGAHKSISLNPTLDTLSIQCELGTFEFVRHGL